MNFKKFVLNQSSQISFAALSTLFRTIAKTSPPPTRTKYAIMPIIKKNPHLLEQIMGQKNLKP